MRIFVREVDGKLFAYKAKESATAKSSIYARHEVAVKQFNDEQSLSRWLKTQGHKRI
jgi:hypothetical protein